MINTKTAPDHDPDNPHHYHDKETGGKVILDDDAWKRLQKTEDTRAYGQYVINAVEEHNNAEQRNPEYEKAYNNLVKNAAGPNGALAVNWWDGKKWGYAPLPEGYKRDEKGVVTDMDGNYYTPLPNSENSAFSTPYRDFHGGEGEQHYGRVTMPEKTITFNGPVRTVTGEEVRKSMKKAYTDYVLPRTKFEGGIDVELADPHIMVTPNKDGSYHVVAKDKKTGKVIRDVTYRNKEEYIKGEKNSSFHDLVKDNRKVTEPTREEKQKNIRIPLFKIDYNSENHPRVDKREKATRTFEILMRRNK